MTLVVPVLLTLSACSSTRSSSRYPGSRTIPTPSGDVIVMPDGQVYRDANRNGIPDRDEQRNRRNEGRTTVCHKGRTQVVGNAAVQAHLRHGDYVGRCESNRNDRNGRYERDDDDRNDRQGRYERGKEDDHERGHDRDKHSRGRGHHD